MNFNEYYFTESGKTVEGIKSNLKIEYGIVDVINSGKTRLLRFESAIQSIVTYFNLKPKAMHTGNISGEIRSEYIDIIKSIDPNLVQKINKTSKTDFIASDQKISLKLNKGWLFSHQLEGTEICLFSVLDSFKEIEDNLKKELKSILQELRSLPKNTLEKSFVFKNELTERFIEIFKSFEEEIKIEFLRSGLSGNFKFKENNIAMANKLMVIKFKNSKMSTTDAFLNPNNLNLDKSGIYDIFKDDFYIKELIKTCRLKFIFQKKGPLRLDINNYDFGNDILNEEYKEFLKEDFFSNLQNLLSKGYEFVKDKIQKFIDFLIQLLNKGISYFLNFLGIQIISDFENEIIFP